MLSPEQRTEESLSFLPSITLQCRYTSRQYDSFGAIRHAMSFRCLVREWRCSVGESSRVRVCWGVCVSSVAGMWRDRKGGGVGCCGKTKRPARYTCKSYVVVWWLWLWWWWCDSNCVFYFQFSAIRSEKQERG